MSGYTVYRGSTKVANDTGTSYTDAGLTGSTAYSYTGTAQDPSGNTSAPSSALSGTRRDGPGRAAVAVLDDDLGRWLTR